MSYESLKGKLRHERDAGVDAFWKNLALIVDKKNDILYWAFTVILGLGSVWIPFIVYQCYGRTRLIEIFTDGSLLKFSTTFSAISLGFFFRETRVPSRKSLVPVYIALVLTLAISLVVLAVLYAQQLQAGAPPAAQLSLRFIAGISSLLVFLAIASNFRLSLAEMSSVEVIERALNADARQQAQQANTATNVDGTKL